MVLLRLRQYIDVHCVSDSQEDVGSGFKGTAGDGICHVAFDSTRICVKWLWRDRSATQNDVHLYHAIRYAGAKVFRLRARVIHYSFASVHARGVCVRVRERLFA